MRAEKNFRTGAVGHCRSAKWNHRPEDNSTSRRLSNRRKELLKRHIESGRQAAQSDDADVALAALDTPDVVPMQLGPSGEFLLRHSELSAQLSNPASDCLRQVHTGSVAACTLWCLHTIVVIPSQRGTS
jgi:hypothetical protein